MIRFVVRAAAAAAMALCALAAQAQAWTSKPVHFIVPFPPGGSWSIGTAFAAKSPPDGYTYVFVFDMHATNPSLIPNLPYDTLHDLAPVMLVGTAPMAIVTGASKPYKTFGDVVAAAKAKPDTLSIGSVGNGSLGHLAMIVVQQMGGFRVTHVPYK